MNAETAPVEIKLRRQSRVLEVSFDDGSRYELPLEFLRVHSPSAEVKGHGPGQETLVTGKQNVGITAVEPVGQYAIRPTFSDGHNSGIFSWDYLYEIAVGHDRMWNDYLHRLEAAGASREPADALRR